MTIHTLPLSYDPGAPKAIIYSINYKAMSFSAGLCRVEDIVESSVWLLASTPLMALASLDGGGQL